MMMMMMMNIKILKSRRSGFSRGKLEAGRNELVLCTARYELLLVCSEGLARLSRRVWRRFVRGSHEISLVPSLHRASTDALMRAVSTCYIRHTLINPSTLILRYYGR